MLGAVTSGARVVRDFGYKTITNTGAYFHKNEAHLGDSYAHLPLLAESIVLPILTLLGKMSEETNASLAGALENVQFIGKGLMAPFSAYHYVFSENSDGAMQKDYFKSAHELLLWGVRGAEKVLSISGHDLNENTKEILGVVKELGSMAGIVVAYQDANRAISNRNNHPMENGVLVDVTGRPTFRKQEEQEAAAIFRLATAVLFGVWNVAELIGSRVDNFKSITLAARSTYVIVDMMRFVFLEENYRSDLRVKNNKA